jgi:DNA mismatch repair protein MutS
LTLTSRDKGENAVPMAGFPYHQLDSYLRKLIKQGIRVAVCEQVEDPKTAKGLVKREITQIVSPGTITDGELLDPHESNYLAAVVAHAGDQTRFGAAWLDLSTGQFAFATVDRTKLLDLAVRFQFREVLVSETQAKSISEMLVEFPFTARPDWSFSPKHARDLLLSHFEVLTLDGFGIEDADLLAVQAAGSVLHYVQETQNSTLDHIDALHKYASDEHVEIDHSTWQSLEISHSCRGGSADGTLFSVLNSCMTPMGARQIGTWLSAPLRRVVQINRRLDAVAEFVQATNLRNEIRGLLRGVYDLQRLVARVTTGRCAPRDLSAIARTLKVAPALKAKLAGRSSVWIQELEAELDPCTDLRSELERGLNDPCPAQLRDGGVIKSGYAAPLDELRNLASGGKKWIANYQKSIVEQSGINSLKIGYNKVFGYYLEVTHTHSHKIPDYFIRKQTLKNAERYVTAELKEYEEKVLSADEKALALEAELFQSLRDLVRTYTSRLKTIAEVLAALDAITSLAHLASSRSYCRPEIRDDNSLLIAEGRHPVLDVLQPTGVFVPNDTAIDDDLGFVHVITGPNMAGKSTYIRQVALITLMAQIGSFVPAKQARIGVVDKIFARIGASDELSRGRSTFMVEMTEAARILNTATSRSLVILDEIGRGTSTYDGVSLAWSIIEYIHDHLGCRTLFATHYHELIELESTFTGVKNYNVSIREWDDKIVFLHKIVAGGADKSYGIHVARLAGIPDWVSSRAEQILSRLETNSTRAEQSRQLVDNAKSRSKGQWQMTLFEIADHPLLEKIRQLDANHVTPMKALELLQQWKQDIDQNGSHG